MLRLIQFIVFNTKNLNSMSCTAGIGACLSPCFITTLRKHLGSEEVRRNIRFYEHMTPICPLGTFSSTLTASLCVSSSLLIFVVLYLHHRWTDKVSHCLSPTDVIHVHSDAKCVLSIGLDYRLNPKD